MYRLTPAQESLWFLQRAIPLDLSYHIPVILTFDKQLDVEKIQLSVKLLLEKHESLRAVFVKTTSGLMQSVTPTPNIEFSFDCGSDDEFDRFKDRFFTKQFDLKNGPLIRFALFQFNSGKSSLLVNMHHIISDGKSVGLIAKDVSNFYNLQIDHDVDCTKPKKTYKWYVEWVNQETNKNRFHVQLNYWQERLSGVYTHLRIKTDFDRPKIRSYIGEAYEIKIPVSLIEKIKSAAFSVSCSIFVKLFSCYLVLMHKKSESGDIVLGTTTANRFKSRCSDLVGLFANTVPYRSVIAKEDTFERFLIRTNNQIQTDLKNAEVSLGEIVQRINPPRSMAMTPLIQHVFSYQEEPWANLSFDGAVLQSIHRPVSGAKFDMAVNLRGWKNEIVCTIEYSTALFNRDTIAAHMEAYFALTDTLITNPNLSLSVFT